MKDISASDKSQILSAALTYIENGLAVIPLLANTKVPAIAGWTTGGLPSAAQCHKWFGNGSNYNIGIRTGAVSGVFVIDVDVRHGGFQTWATIKRDYCFSDDTAAKVVTPSGGLHIYYLIPDGRITKTSAGRPGPGVDIRGEGGQVAAPPSVIDGIPYRWKDEPFIEWTLPTMKDYANIGNNNDTD